MRTTAEVQHAGSKPAAAPAKRGRGSARAGGDAAPAATIAAPVGAEPQPVAVTGVRLLRLDEGLYSLRIGELAGLRGEAAGMAVPAAQVAVPFAEGGGVEVVAAFPRRGPWLGRDGGTVILRSPIGGGTVMVTAYGSPGQPAGELSLDLQRLDGPPRPGATAAAGVGEPVSAQAGERDVQTEVLLHIERAGDRLFPGRGWVGALGRRMRIEAFSVRPLERLAPADIELRAYMPNGGETPWVPGGVLCGTRGRGLPLAGFAVRVAPHRADRFEVQYQGSFFSGGISETRRDGEPCRSQTPDDPLEAVNIRLIERAADGGSAGA
jgi:hypothetical protein